MYDKHVPALMVFVVLMYVGLLVSTPFQEECHKVDPKTINMCWKTIEFHSTKDADMRMTFY